MLPQHSVDLFLLKRICVASRHWIIFSMHVFFINNRAFVMDRRGSGQRGSHGEKFYYIYMMFVVLWVMIESFLHHPLIIFHLLKRSFPPCGFLLFSNSERVHCISIVHGYLKWLCSWDPYSILLSYCIIIFSLSCILIFSLIILHNNEFLPFTWKFTISLSYYHHWCIQFLVGWFLAI